MGSDETQAKVDAVKAAVGELEAAVQALVASGKDLAQDVVGRVETAVADVKAKVDAIF